MFNSQHIITSKHYLILCTVSFALGVFLFVYLDRTLLFFLAVILSMVLIALAVILLGLKLFFRKAPFRTKPILLPAALVFCMLLGVFRIYSFELPETGSLRQYENKEVWLSGIVSSVPKINPERNICSFEFDVLQADKTPAKETVVMYVPATRSKKITLGQRLHCWSMLTTPERTAEQGNFDYFTHLRGRNILLMAKTKNANIVTFNSKLSPSFYIRSIGLKIRQHFSETIDGLFPKDTEGAAILKGILLGDKSNFSDELYNSFSNSGISHIVAVSGLHVSILFSFLITAFSVLRINRKIGLAAALPLLLIFTAVSAFSLSVCRAALMMLVTVIATLLCRRYDSVTSLFLALGIILMVAPYSLFSKSLLLSFSATFGIFAYYKYINTLIKLPFRDIKSKKTFSCKALEKVLTSVLSSVSLTLSTLVGTGYFLALFFGKISKVQFLTNLWIIPFVSVIFVLGYITIFAFSVLPTFTSAVLVPFLKGALWVVKATVHTFSDDRFSLAVPQTSLGSTAFIIYFGLAVMLYFTLKLIYDRTKR